MTIPMKVPPQADIMEQVLLKGDIAKLTPAERVSYYDAVCKSLGLNPLTKPFEFIVLNGKMQLYALRTCADQLRKINAVSIEIVSQSVEDGILTIHVRARLPDGRTDEDLGAVAFPDTLKGEARANAELKAITKAKRRVTMSICGLGWLDENEIDDIQASKRPAKPAANVMFPAHNTQTGEITDVPPSPPRSSADQSGASQTHEEVGFGEAPDPEDEKTAADYDMDLGEAAKKGMVELQECWMYVPKQFRTYLKAALDRRHKPVAQAVDRNIVTSPIDR